jgi:hypothetical protein
MSYEEGRKLHFDKLHKLHSSCNIDKKIRLEVQCMWKQNKYIKNFGSETSREEI